MDQQNQPNPFANPPNPPGAGVTPPTPGGDHAAAVQQLGPGGLKSILDRAAGIIDAGSMFVPAGPEKLAVSALTNVLRAPWFAEVVAKIAHLPADQQQAAVVAALSPPGSAAWSSH